MANRNFETMGMSLIKGEVHIYGSFTLLAGAGTIDATLVKGLGFGYAPGPAGVTVTKGSSPGVTSTAGIARTSAGLYTVTLEDPYIDAIDYEAHLLYPSGGTLTNRALMLTAPTNLGNGQVAPTFTIETVNSGGSATDLGTTFRCGFHIWLRNSSSVGFKP